jgi:hypothetical protein
MGYLGEWKIVAEKMVEIFIVNMLICNERKMVKR